MPDISEITNDRYVHVGYPKTGTSVLQKIVLPKACNYSNLLYWSNDCSLKESINRHTKFILKYGYSAEKIDIPKRTFISSESLCSLDPHYWKEYAEKNLLAFGPNVHIVLTIREPKSLLSSLYIQVCLQEFNGIQHPKDYFIGREVYSERLPAAKFSLDEFKYSDLIDLYKNRFKALTVIKYEDIRSLNFLQRILRISDFNMNKLRGQIKVNSINKSYSVLSVKLTFALSRFLNKFSLSLGPNKSNSVVSSALHFNHSDNKKQKGIFKKILRRILLEMNWRHFLQTRLDRFIPYKKYMVDFSDFKQIDVLCEEYKKMPSEVTYINGVVDFKSDAYFHNLHKR